MKKKIYGFLIALVLTIGILPAVAMTAFGANEAVYYQYSAENLDGTAGRFWASAEVNNYELIDNNHKPTEWGNGWYVVRGDVTFDDQVRVAAGIVHLILTDGCHLTCNNSLLITQNMYFPEQTTLVIYSQSYGDEMGKLTVIGKDGYAAIGSAPSDFATSCGDLIIHGGNIEAVSEGNGAGIGGGFGGDGGKVTVYGGRVLAKSRFNGAGIGGGCPIESDGGNGGEFTIYDGYVEARGYTGAGIGGGPEGNGGKINLYGGTVYAVSKDEHDGRGAGLAFGGGAKATNNGSITVGTGLSLFDENGQRINGDFDPQDWEDIFSESKTAYVTIAPSLHPETYQAYNTKTGMYETKQCSGYTFLNKYFTTWTDGWYVADGSGSFDSLVTVTGNVHLIIEDGKSLKAPQRIHIEEGASLSVYSQSDGENQGQLRAVSTYHNAAIGGGESQNSGTLIVHGGTIIAEGGFAAPAIGGGYGGNGGVFTIYGGKVYAQGGYGARAIGAGVSGSQNGIFVVRAGYELLNLTTGKHIIRTTGENWTDILDQSELSFTVTPAEIPDQEPVAYRYYDDDIVLNEAEITRYRVLEESEPLLLDGWYVAKGSLNFSSLTAIGEVHLILMDGSNVTVKQGFHVNEGSHLSIYDQPDGDEQGREKGSLYSSIKSYDKRNYRAAGIGGDSDLSGGSITIHGGTIVAEGGNGAAGIGGGQNGCGGDITIYGGNVSAIGSQEAAGIGGSGGCGCGQVTINGGVISALSLADGAGIGTGAKGKGGTIIINGGSVTAISTVWGAGIGIGADGSSVDVTINGGIVMATGGLDGLVNGDGAGICANSLTVSGGMIDAKSGSGFDAVIADIVFVSPKETMNIHVVTENGIELSLSPFTQGTNITALLLGHTEVHFKETGMPYMGSFYKTTLDTKIANGTITVDKPICVDGDIVTLFATPSQGYEFGSWDVRDKNGDSVTVNEEDQFVMPKGGVTVSATFVPLGTPTDPPGFLWLTLLAVLGGTLAVTIIFFTKKKHKNETKNQP